MSSRQCKYCGRPMLVVQTRGGEPLALDVQSRKYIFQVSDTSVDLVAAQVDPQEIYIAHALVCRGPTGVSQ